MDSLICTEIITASTKIQLVTGKAESAHIENQYLLTYQKPKRRQ